MLSQVNLWVERVGMVVDVILLGRMLMLKLPRTYVFIFLFAVLNLFYDGMEVWLGQGSKEFSRVAILSRFVYAIVFPLVTWDLFEEATTIVEKIRRLAMTRMISSLIFITLWGLLIAAFTGEDGDSSHYLMRLALVVWTGSVAATFAFLWVMRRGVKAGAMQLPHNTSVWFLYFQLILAVEAASCLLLLVLQSMQSAGTKVTDMIAQISDPILEGCGILFTVWCVFNLRVTPGTGADVPADVKL